MNMNNIQFPKENNKSINYKLILQYLIKNDIFFKIKKFEYVISFNEDSFFKEHQDELIITQEPNEKCFRLYYKKRFRDIPFFYNCNVVKFLDNFFKEVKSPSSNICQICYTDNIKIRWYCKRCSGWVCGKCQDEINKLNQKCSFCREQVPIVMINSNCSEISKKK